MKCQACENGNHENCNQSVRCGCDCNDEEEKYAQEVLEAGLVYVDDWDEPWEEEWDDLWEGGIN